MPHHHDHSSPHKTDHGVLKRIRGIAWANGLVGTAEFVAGIITNSSTLTMAGLHDTTDGALYSMKHKAACEPDHNRKQRLRKRAAMGLIGATALMGGFEIAQDLTDPHHQPETIAAGIAIVAASANIAAAGIMHGKRHHHDAQDSWKHVVGVDVPGSLVTLAITPLSVKYPELDIVGAASHMVLATSVGIMTLRHIQVESAVPRHMASVTE